MIFAVTILVRFFQVASRQGALDPVGPRALHIEHLFWFIFWICLFVFVVVNVLFWYGAKRRVLAGENPRGIIENPDGDRKAAWGVGFAVAFTVVVLFTVLFLSLRASRVVQATSAENPVTIEITGHQWWWEVVYPDSQSDLQISTANEIHVPIHERIAVVTKSVDVIHSFWAPNITGKRDLIPGYASSLSFEVDKPGIYRGQCAEFCGLQHAHMGFLIVAESRDEFESWKQNQLRDAPEPVSKATSHGREVFLSHACVMCHTIRGTDAASHMGPDLTHLASRREIAAGTLPNVRGALAGWILDPQSIKPGNHMALNIIGGEELNDLLDYLGTLK
ncbi:MAG: cytochrome c oxidase subunit II [Acidobacteria bacterium]|nr:cytochrome c oxidase subunit II [Acidobacteriota bacterium]